MRGYFALGAENISKPLNFGALLRTAHAFGAHFSFAITPYLPAREIALSDTSNAVKNLPLHLYPSVDAMRLPEGCRLVGLELTDEAVALPSFRHPLQAAYVVGPERGSLSPELQARCDFIVQIPTRFCVNLAVAAAITLYDRMICLGRFAERPVRAGGPNSTGRNGRAGPP